MLILTLSECPIKMLCGTKSRIIVHVHTDDDNYDYSIQPCLDFLPLYRINMLYKKQSKLEVLTTLDDAERASFV